MKDTNIRCRELPHPKDLKVFLTVIRKLNFATAAEELGQSPAYISKRIGILESNLNVRLFHRSSRKIILTNDGVRMQHWAKKILANIDAMVDDFSNAKETPRGPLHICSTFGFGRKVVAPAIAELSEKFPELEVRLEVFDRAVNIVQEGFDLEIRLGEDLPRQHNCTKLKENKRILCASPEYLAKWGKPQTLSDLNNHNCFVLKERNSPLGVWNFDSQGKDISLPIKGNLSSNHGEIVLQWTLEGRGIMMRSLWDVKDLLQQGDIVQILPNYTQNANIYAVYPSKLTDSANLRECVKFLKNYLAETA
jgi:LysR family transcriptional regulator, transcriptional activator for dmlA